MKKHFTFSLILLSVLIFVFFFVPEKFYLALSLVLCILPAFVSFCLFEKKKTSSVKLVLISLMTSFSVIGRIVFAAFPSFKPVSAFVFICGMYLGFSEGFLCGSLSAIISNIYFGFGPWVPFQMLAWGIVGLLGGMFKNKSLRLFHIVPIGIVTGFLFSFVTDFYTVLFMYSGFEIKKLLFFFVTALPMTLTYVISDTVFLFLFIPISGKIKKRLAEKFGEF